MAGSVYSVIQNLQTSATAAIVLRPCSSGPN